MAKDKYNWEESRAVFEVFRAISVNNEITVNQLAEVLKKSPSSISDKLATLRKQKMVIANKRGKEVFYTVNMPYMEKKCREVYGETPLLHASTFRQYLEKAKGLLKGAQTESKKEKIDRMIKEGTIYAYIQELENTVEKLKTTRSN